MARDPLDALLRLRRLAVREQMRNLAGAIRAEEQAHEAQLACAETITRETAEARSMAERNAAWAGFMLWRARATRALRDAEAQALHAHEATHAARSLLGDARGAMRAVELALDRRTVAAELTAQQVTQHALDDATRRPAVA
jgi:hypothetical protein